MQKLFFLSSLITLKAFSFCGFYVAKADAKLFNKASQVVYVRDQDRTVLSLMNDYQGPLKDFAFVVPVPEVLTKEQINVGEAKLFERIDAFSAPRLVEYYDENPCQRMVMMEARSKMAMSAAANMSAGESNTSLGVKVEAKFTVGEYDILILSAKESTGLETWLKQNNYKIPSGASNLLSTYIQSGMKFFVAKVNLGEQTKTGLNYLRPLQMAFETSKFMLPIRLGLLNAQGDQDLIVYAITKNGRVETTNYRTAKFPTDFDIPLFVKDDFASFYKDLFAHQVKKEGRGVVFTEHFWDMNSCDPCSSEPLSHEELKKLGVFWLNERVPPSRFGFPGPWGGPQNQGGVKVTRLHVRYNLDTFKEDLVFHETKDEQFFQTRFVLRHPWTGSPTECKEAKSYFDNLSKRQDKEAQNLAFLTGWDIGTVRNKMKLASKPKPWWENLWN